MRKLMSLTLFVAALMLAGVIVAPQSLNAQCVPPPAGMVGWWSLDEMSGPTANDIAGSTNNSGVWMNSPVPVTGKVSGALSFNGSNSVDVPDHSELNFGTGDFSIDLWIKTTDASASASPILDKRTGTIPNLTGYVLYLYNGYLGSQIADGSGYSNWVSTGFVADGNWHHVAVTVDRDNPSGWLHYVDGSVVEAPANPTAYQESLTNTAPLVMARNLISPSHMFTGTLDEIDLFNRVLDPAEIHSIWTADSFGKCKDTCYADGDVNDDDITLSTTDLAYLNEFIHGSGPAPVPMYSGDLTGDGYVNQADIDLFNAYFIYGMSVFTNGYPVPCPCNPIAEPMPDTVNIFGLEHTSMDWADLTTVGDTLKVTRLNPNGGDGFSVDLKDIYCGWYCLMQDPDNGGGLPAGAEIEMSISGVVDGEPDEYIGSMYRTKVSDSVWQIAVKTEASSYTLEGYLDGVLVFRESGLGASTKLPPWEHYGIGYFGTPFADPWVTSWHCSSLYTDFHQEMGMILDSYDDPLIFTPAGMSDTFIVDEIAVITEGMSYDGQFSSVSLCATDIDSFAVTFETHSLVFDDLCVSNLGNAILMPIDCVLVVSNCGPSGNDGAMLNLIPNGYDDIILTRTVVDVGDATPIGASFRAAYEFGVVGDESFPMESFFDFAGANTWNLGVESNHPLYTVEAYNNETSVFSAEGITATDLGYIVESAKGVYPVGFRGGSSGKPASVVASAGYDFTAHPDGVQWSWAAQGVSGLTIDYLSVISDTTVAGNNPVELSASICASNGGAKDDPISFTILDILVESSCCQLRGDINHNGTGPDIADLVYLVNFMFSGGDGPPCLEETDVNGDGNGPDIADLVYIVNYMFNSGPEPVPCGEEAPPLLSKAGAVDPDISIELSHEDGFTIITLNSPVDLRGVQLEMTGNGSSEPINLAGDHLDLVSGRDGITVKIGILDLDGGEIIMAGSNAIVRLDGDYSLESALVADMAFRSVTPSTVSSAKETSLPGDFVLNQNYPNPFNPTTQISFSLPNATDVRLEIFNVLGQRVTTLVDEAMEAGQHVVQWDGDKISSGVYFYRLTSDKNVETKKMMLLK